MDYTFGSLSLNDLNPTAEKIIQLFPDQRVFTLYGSMGSGKTTFIQKICNFLHVSDEVRSPTFSIVNEYHTDKGCSVFHFDFYRIKKLEEVYDIGYEEYIYSGDYCFIEWPEIIQELLPEKFVYISIEESGIKNRRNIVCYQKLNNQK